MFYGKAIVLLLETKCPEDAPYAFMWGRYCCKHPEENKVNVKDGTQITAELKGCDGGKIGFDSTCCKNNAKKICPNIKGCIDNRGKIC